MSDTTDSAELAERVADDSIQGDIEQAQAAGDHEKAQRLYKLQQGVEPDGVDVGAGEVDDVSPSDIESMGGDAMADYVPYDSLTEDEKDKAFEGVIALSDPDTSKGLLQGNWPGAEYDKNREFGNAALSAIPGALEAVRVLETVGIADHPALVRFIVSAGRMMAATPGDAASIPSTISKDRQMEHLTRDAIDDRIDDLQDQIDKAMARGNRRKANALYQQQLLLDAQIEGNAPIVGSRGRTA